MTKEPMGLTNTERQLWHAESTILGLLVDGVIDQGTAMVVLSCSRAEDLAEICHRHGIEATVVA